MGRRFPGLLAVPLAMLAMAMPPAAASAGTLTYVASGSFGSGITLGGTITVDTLTELVSAVALTTSNGGSLNQGGSLLACVDVSVPCVPILANSIDFTLTLFVETTTLTLGGTLPLYDAFNFPSLGQISNLEQNVSPYGFWDLQSGSLTAAVGTAIPEPPAWALVGIGAGLLCAARRRAGAQARA